MSQNGRKSFAHNVNHHYFHQVNRNTLEEDILREPVVSWRSAFLLGVAMKLGGCTIAWNYGFVVGFGEYLMSVVIIGIAYLCLGLCMAEIVSIMSFSGGYYGYARCAIGPYSGFIVGCCGIFESTFQMSVSVLKIGQFITIVAELSDNYEPLWWFLTFLCVLCCHYFGGKWFWHWISVISILGLLLILIYLLGSIPNLNFPKYVENSNSFANDPMEFFSVFRLSVLFFLGFDMLTLTSSEVINPKIGEPKAMICLICFLFVFAMWLIVTVACQSPGINEELYQLTTFFPLMFGYETIFGLSRRAAICICVIPSIATPLGYMYVVGKQVHSMAKSGLLPSIFTHTVGEARVPILGMLFVIVLAFMGLFYTWTMNPYTTLSRFATLAGCIVYLAMFSCYIIFNTRFSNMERSFRNPLGIGSAIFGILIFASIFIIMVFVNLDYYQVTLMFFGYLLFMTLYYYTYAEAHQFFSVSEQKVFFKAYIVNMKRRKRKSVHHRIVTDIYKVCTTCWYLLIRKKKNKKRPSIHGKVYCKSRSRRSTVTVTNCNDNSNDEGDNTISDTVRNNKLYRATDGNGNHNGNDDEECSSIGAVIASSKKKKFRFLSTIMSEQVLPCDDVYDGDDDNNDEDDDHYDDEDYRLSTIERPSCVVVPVSLSIEAQHQYIEVNDE